MAVVIETTLGDITVDLFVEQRPQTCLNFIKLCRIKYYNYNLFHMVRSGFIAQTGDPTGEGSGGQSIWGKIFGSDKSFFSGEKMPRIRHTHAGLLSMVCIGDTMVGSQFFFTLAPNLDSLDGVHCVIGAVTEGIDVLRKFNDIICDESYRPYQDVRITHTVILEDPFLDPPGLVVPSRSPSPSAERLACGRIAPDEEIDETKGKSTEEIQEIIEEKEAKARATILEIVGDLPDADIAPPENVLFVCKLNPVTTDDDLEIIFSRFGKIVSCEVIRDKKSGDSLQYAFIEFADKKSCEDAYFKMDNVLIDDRRIHVDFSQSVSKIKWLGKGKGVKHFTDNGPKDTIDFDPKSRRSRSRNKEEAKRRDRNSPRKRENSSRRYNDENQYTKSEQHRERKGETKSRYRLERSRSKSKYERRKRDRTPNENSHKARDRCYNSRHSRHGDKARDKYCLDKDKKIRDTQTSPIRHKEKHNREKQIGHNVNGKKDEDYISSGNKKNYENENMGESPTIIDKSKKKNRNDKSPGTPPKDKSLKTKIQKQSSSKKTNKNYVKSVKKKRKPSLTSSSDSESSASSSSSESSSTSESDSNKRKRKRKRNLSTSSSSSSSTTTSSSSESSSSSDSSSESSKSKKRKRKKVETKKISKKKQK